VRHCRTEKQSEEVKSEERGGEGVEVSGTREGDLDLRKV
jgi:hypothetical protein